MQMQVFDKNQKLVEHSVDEKFIKRYLLKITSKMIFLRYPKESQIEFVCSDTNAFIILISEYNEDFISFIDFVFKIAAAHADKKYNFKD